MIQFEDAKFAIESIYGPIRGYKMIAWSTISDDKLTIGDNYVFCGEIFVNTSTLDQTLVTYATSNNTYSIIYHQSVPNNSYGYASIITEDNSFLGAIVVVSANQPNSVSVLGWVFQIDK